MLKMTWKDCHTCQWTADFLERGKARSKCLLCWSSVNGEHHTGNASPQSASTGPHRRVPNQERDCAPPDSETDQLQSPKSLQTKVSAKIHHESLTLVTCIEKKRLHGYRVGALVFLIRT